MSLTLLGGGIAVTARVPATLVSEIIPAAGTTIRLTFSAAISPGGEPVLTTSGFSGGAVSVSSITSGGGIPATAFDLNLSRTVSTGETGGLVTYGGSGITTIANGLTVAAFTNVAVTNNSTA